MKHLLLVNMTYFEHMKFVLKNAFCAIVGAFFLVIHALLPDIFTDSGSSIINGVHYDLMNNRKYKNRILVRFNTKWQVDELKRKWRVLENDIEHLAQDVEVTIPCVSIQEDVQEGTRWHFLCWGDVYWKADKATIR